MKVVDMDVSFH